MIARSGDDDNALQAGDSKDNSLENGKSQTERPIELAEIPPADTSLEMPEITVDEADSVVKNYQPYGNYSSQLSRSTTHLTLDSVNSAGSSSGLFTNKRRVRHTNAFTVLVDLKNKIFGTDQLPPTENGRIIPITFESNINEYFGAELYDPVKKALIDERRYGPYISNAITSSKYSIYSFLPKQLKAQFSKLANCYFMVVAIMQMIPSWSTTGQFTTIIPLMIFMSISIAREGFDDWKRHVHDKEENGKSCTVIRDDENLSSYDTQSINTIMTETIQINNETNGVSNSLSDDLNNSSFSPSALRKYNLKECKTKWKSIKVGDVIRIKEDEWIPADVLLLTSTNTSGTAYIETMALDGETNLKMKSPPLEINKIASRASGLRNLNQLITVEDPNLDLYNFEGVVNIQNESRPLGPDNVIYRGSILRNTDAAYGVVIFTGEETKIRMNNIKNPRTKAPKLQRNINYIVLFMVFVVASLSAFSTMAQKILWSDNKSKAWYLYGQDVGTAPTLMGFIIMYNTLIPLSLYVTMEIIKVVQLLFLQYDIDMYHIESNTPADAKTATILEELGQVSYVFSDKTGTLTDNMMLFRKFSVNGVSWLHDLDIESKVAFDVTSMNPSTSRKELPVRKSTTTIARESMDTHKPRQSGVSWKSPAQPSRAQDSKTSIELLKFIQSNPDTLFSKKAKFFMLSIALCSTCLPKRSDDGDSSINSSALTIEETTDASADSKIAYQAASPDERALIEAARDLGYIVFDKQESVLTIKTYPKGFKNAPKYEEYKVLDVIEFSSARKRMSIIVQFPDKRICIICKGADNVIIEKLKNSAMAKQKAIEISANSAERKTMEADVILQERFSQEDPRQSMGSLSSLRLSLQMKRGPEHTNTLNSIDDYLTRSDDADLEDIAQQSRKSLHIQQAKKYSLDVDSSKPLDVDAITKNIPDDRLLINEEFLIEKTLEHVEEFSTEGLRTLLYSFRWLDAKEYDDFSSKYQAAKTALTDRNVQVENVGASVEHSFELLGATAIEDKLQEGVSDAIERLRRAGIKMWMLTGDKRETAINIGHSCRLIKDYSLIAILNIDLGKEDVRKVIADTTKQVKGGSVAHCVVVIDGATLKEIEDDLELKDQFIELCVLADSAICCRASPSQKANMVTAIRTLNKKSVTLAIGDGANDIAMIQSADIGVGITGKEGLQAARASDYSIAQFRFLLKLLLVNGRYNYVRTSKFVLCTFYKELIFYLTQTLYQRQTLFSGSSVYESWSLSMFNTLFTSLPVLVVGMFDKDLKPATLLAVPELYAKGRLYQAFNLKIFVSWMVLAAFQSVGLSFLAWYLWGFAAMRDNTTLPLGTLTFAALVIIINAKCEFIEVQNRTWLCFAAFIISVGGYGLWNVIIMGLYRSKRPTIFFVDYGLLEFGADQSWWATLLVIFTVCLLIDILIKVFKYSIKPGDDEIFKSIERDLEMRRNFEERAFKDLKQGWTIPKDASIFKKLFRRALNKVDSSLGVPEDDIDTSSALHRKRAGTNPGQNELPAGSEPDVIVSSDFKTYDDGDYEVLPSGKRIKKKKNSAWSFNFRKNDDEDIEAIISDRLAGER